VQILLRSKCFNFSCITFYLFRPDVGSFHLWPLTIFVFRVNRLPFRITTLLTCFVDIRLCVLCGTRFSFNHYVL